MNISESHHREKTQLTWFNHWADYEKFHFYSHTESLFHSPFTYWITQSMNRLTTWLFIEWISSHREILMKWVNRELTYSIFNRFICESNHILKLMSWTKMNKSVRDRLIDWVISPVSCINFKLFVSWVFGVLSYSIKSDIAFSNLAFCPPLCAINE